mgnify:FL=1
MKKLILFGHSGSGKTTLTQTLRGEKIEYQKTQYVLYGAQIIDTPGEYAENRQLGRALALYAYEADICALLVSATEQYSIFGPNITSMTNREVIGIITKTDLADANADLAETWLKIAGCTKIFRISSVTGEGIKELSEYLNK